MNRVLLFLLIGSGLSTLWAQADLTRADVFTAGDVIEYLAVDATNADPGPAGVGVTWDFSNLPRRPADDFVVTYADPSAAPNSSIFPEANLVAIQDAGPVTGYTFFNATNQRFTLEGLDLPELGTVTYSDKSIWVNFPFSYNETESDPFVGSYQATIQGLVVVTNRTGSLMTHYDGWGTIILPDGSRVSNVRRLKMNQTVTDVISVSGVTITTEVVTTTYNFFAQGDRTQVFQLTLADSSVSPPGTTVSSKVASYLADGGNQNPPLASRRGAHLTSPSGGFDSEILIFNPTASPQTLTLEPLDGNGSALAPREVVLQAGAVSRQLQQTYFPANAQSFAVSGCDDCIFSVGYRATIEDGSTAQVHQTGDFGSEYYFYPGEWDLLFDGVALINSGTDDAEIQVTQMDYDGDMVAQATLETDLAPGAKHLSLFNSLLVNDPNTIVKLTSSQPLAVMILRISNDKRFLYQNLPLPAQAGSGDERWIAHITSETGGFDTDVFIHNNSGQDRTVTFHPYSADGQAMNAFDVNVSAGETRRFAKTDIFDGETSHAAVSGATECLVSVGYRSRQPGSSTAAIHEAQPLGNSFFIYPGEWDVLYDGLALVNTGNANATITVTQISDNGQPSQAVELISGLAPNAKYLGLLEGQIPENPNSIIRVDSTQPLAILSLRLSKDGRYLYSNNPLPQ